MFQKFREKRKAKARKRAKKRYDEYKEKHSSDPPPPNGEGSDLDIDKEDITDVINFALDDFEQEQRQCNEQTRKTIEKLHSIAPPEAIEEK